MVLLFVILPRSAGAADWPMFRGDASRTGVTTNTGPNERDARIAWQYVTGGLINSSPAVVGGNVYVGSADGNLYAIDARSGEFLWNLQTGGAVLSSPAVSGTYVFVGSWDGLYRVDTVSYDVTHLYSSSAVDSSPLVADLGNGAVSVYFSTGSGELIAIDAMSGVEKWRSPHDHRISALSSPAFRESGGTPTVFVGSVGGLNAYNAIDGTFLGTLSLNGSVDAAPVVVGNMVYVGSSSSTFYMIDAKDPAKMEACDNKTTRKTSRFSSAAVKGEFVYVSIDDGLWALRQTVPEDGSNCSLTEVWLKKQATPLGGLVSSPAVDNSLVYVGSGDGVVYAFDAITGAEQWSLSTKSAQSMNSSPAIVDGMLYIGSSDGVLYAIASGQSEEQAA